MDNRLLATLNSLGLLILRLGIGGYMVTHGWGKVQMLQAGAEFGDPIGIGAGPSLILIVIAEFVCALLVLVGLGTRIAALILVGAMAVAAFVAHGADPWTMGEAAKAFMAGESKTWSSKEPALLYLIPFLALAFTGPGEFSFDALIWPRLRKGKAVELDSAKPAAR